MSTYMTLPDFKNGVVFISDSGAEYEVVDDTPVYDRYHDNYYVRVVAFTLGFPQYNSGFKWYVHCRDSRYLRMSNRRIPDGCLP